ncbi:MAG: ATP-binding cassette domain-containing protein, partial [Ornithinimicrobium sp.]|uniref:ATP-binding cassette domain-containing protein n=1 Tax=Ornithinimicrobium sp. TaxID=1977084 RepID=UPI0026DF903A
DPRCGRFDADVCRLFLEAAESGRPSAELLTLLHAHSPAAVLDTVDVPVYLVQGMTDSLFGIDQSQATAAALRERGVPVAQRWFDGGHDASGPTGLGGEVAAAQEGDSAAEPNGTGDTGNPGDQSLVGNSASEAASAEADAQDEALHTWLAATLGSAPASTSDPATTPAADGAQPLPALAYSLPRAPREQLATLRQVGTAKELTSASGETSLELSPSGPPVILSPPGGTPAALSTVPGAGAIGAGLAGYALAALPTQSTTFDTAPLTDPSTIVGSPRVRLEVTSTGTQTTLFLSLWQLPGNDRQPVAQRTLVAPIRVATTPGQPVEVDVALPAGTYQAPVGARWRVLVSATDTAYRNSTEAAQLQVTLAEPALVVPTVDGTQVGGPRPLDGQSIALLAGLGVLWAALAAWALTQRRITRRHDSATTTARPDLADVPLAVEGLTKAYPDGHQAVSDVRWQALRGQVVGLLGPNGAGKTTTLRMVMGLIRPDAGEVYLLGERVRPGADVLRRVGALVEGPGFLPHLSGRANLEAYWAATGRSHQEARLEEALDVAALGSAIERPVKSYSHGMRQRLGIAQAMLGLPEVLILDEPTNGLDPPQIAALRPILHRYAEAGRCVVISSHLLGEVQQTCSHIVVMDAGRVLVAGSVEEVGVNAEHTLEEVFMSTIDTSRGGHSAPDNERLRQVRPR